MPTKRLLDESATFRAWWHLARSYHSLASALGRFFEERGITGAQFGVLRCLDEAGEQGLMLSDLSRHLMVTCGNITGVVDRLEQAGYLRRERQAADRRVVRARLTPEGGAFYREVLPAYLALLGELLVELTEEETNAISRCCEKLHLALTGQRLPDE